MKFIHLSDLHLGKRVNEFSMLEEQEAILEQILDIVDSEKPDGIFIAGDIYDKSIPPAEAVSLFDKFIAKIAKRKTETFIISGNHDSPERIAFGSSVMNESGIHFSPVYDGNVKPFCIKDEHGEVFVYMLPFVKPTHVRRYFENEEIVTYTDAVRVAVNAMNIDTSKRNVLITHQFVTGASVCGDEEVSVGGTDNVNADVFKDFDYVALGHIHGAQNCGSEKIRYCGTPLKYSLSEVDHAKSVTVVEMGQKGEFEVRTIPLTPIHDMSEVKGTFAELTDPSYYVGKNFKDHYLRIILTDENDVPEALGRLRNVYKNIMRLEYDNTRTRTDNLIVGTVDAETKSAFELFGEFYFKQNNVEMSQEQKEYIRELIEKIEEEK